MRKAKEEVRRRERRDSLLEEWKEFKNLEGKRYWEMIDLCEDGATLEQIADETECDQGYWGTAAIVYEKAEKAGRECKQKRSAAWQETAEKVEKQGQIELAAKYLERAGCKEESAQMWEKFAKNEEKSHDTSPADRAKRVNRAMEKAKSLREGNSTDNQ